MLCQKMALYFCGLLLSEQQTLSMNARKGNGDTHRTLCISHQNYDYYDRFFRAPKCCSACVILHLYLWERPNLFNTSGLSQTLNIQISDCP